MSFFITTAAFQLKAVSSLSSASGICIGQVRFAQKKFPSLYDQLSKARPKAQSGLVLKRIVHYEDEYTVKPLNVTRLGGRDPVTGRKIVQGWGGGIKHKYHWVHFDRQGPTEPNVPPIEEKVIQIVFDGNRSARLALVAGADKMKYYLATVNMKPGDIIRTSSYIPPVRVSANEGDAYPIGALPEGTMIHCLQRSPSEPSRLIHAAGSYGTIVKNTKDHVIVKMPSKHEFVMDRRCMACVGRIGNLEHAKTPIGSAQKWRQLGFRPRSGLWQRKTGRFGRKIRAPKKIVIKDKKDPVPKFHMEM